MSDQRIIFNSSLPRSGSTLLQNILSQNPRFYSSPTSGLVNILIGARVSYTESPIIKAQSREVMKPAFLNLCKRAMEGFYESITDKPVCIDKSRDWIHFYDWVHAFYPQMKVLVCVRDLRAIVSSTEKLFRKNRDLMDRSDIVDNSNMTTIAHRIRHYLTSYPLGVHMMRLMEAIETDRIKQFHIVRFEDLTSNPALAMRKVYEYLDEKPFEHDFEHVPVGAAENDMYSLPYGDHQTRAKVEPLRPDYNDVLGKELANLIKADNAMFYRTFYPQAS